MDNRIIRQASAQDLKQYEAHLVRLVNGSGIDGQPVFNPREPGSFSFTREEEIGKRRGRSVEEAGWQRTWVLCDGNDVRGHVDLHGGAFPSMLHRCEIGMGVEVELQGKGLGRLLAKEALDWVACSSSIEWVDLRVVSTNARAIALYESLGAETVGNIEDAFRLRNVAYGDILMTIRISRTR